MVEEGVDTEAIYYNYIQQYGLGQPHVVAYDGWILNTVSGTICNPEIKLADGRVVTFEDLEILKPSYELNQQRYPLTSAYAKRELITYSSELRANMLVRSRDRTKIDC